jgi:hypothetical protein
LLDEPELVRAASADEPYWTRLMGRYCAHFGATTPSAPLPGLFGGLTFAGSVDGLAAPDQAILQQRLDAVFQQTPWYDRGGVTAGSQLSGRHQLTFFNRQANRTHHWSVQVPYQDTEYYNTTRQVPYQASETYSQQVPYTSYESYSYSCGYGSSYRTCTGSRPVTRYRSESRTRYVTKYRSELERKSRTVTKYRSQPRSQVYVVNEHVGSYATDLSIAVNLGSGAPVVARAQAAHQMIHETSDYGQARLTHTAPLTAPGDWLASRSAALEGALVWELRRAWFNGACAAPASSREQAARCLHGCPDLPEPARAALAAQLQEDAPRLIDLARPGP